MPKSPTFYAKNGPKPISSGQGSEAIQMRKLRVTMPEEPDRRQPCARDTSEMGSGVKATDPLLVKDKVISPLRPV